MSSRNRYRRAEFSLSPYLPEPACYPEPLYPASAYRALSLRALQRRVALRHRLQRATSHRRGILDTSNLSGVLTA
jgi:hypothetical protein